MKNHLHGGLIAFHNRMWEITNITENAVTFALFSPDGDESYPGNLHVQVIYILTPENSLRMECIATADRPTAINLTNHAFFNLQKSKHRKSVLSHLLTLQSNSIVECDKELIPTGNIIDISNSFLDFSLPKTIAASILSGNKTVKKDNGFSVAYVLNKKKNLDLAAVLEDKDSGRSLELYTNQLSLQVYNGYFMNGDDIGRDNIKYYSNAGIALEPQGYPDAPNHPAFPSIFIDENKQYEYVTEYRFGIGP